jgi:hypothetical protein
LTVLFCNISWMKHYAGRTTTDPPLGGGGFPVAEGYCGEECNFVPCEDGFVYGHFETIKGKVDRQVRIERLGAGLADDYVDGLDIVWTAPTLGNDPRTVVGWSRKARLYRHRQEFGDDFPSDQHRRDGITSFRVRAHRNDVFLLPVKERRMNLERGPGWSGQASWWYAEDTADTDAAAFVAAVKTMMDTGDVPPVTMRSRNRKAGRKGRAGAATGDTYQRYVREYEITVHPRHAELQKRFMAHLTAQHGSIEFPACVRDDLRYVVGGRSGVMVEVKPSDLPSLRFAIRTAMGQLLDYRQDQGWTGPQLIVVETEVARTDDLRLAFDNGFGLAWPSDDGFEVVWPDGTRGC